MRKAESNLGETVCLLKGGLKYSKNISGVHICLPGVRQALPGVWDRLKQSVELADILPTNSEG